MIRGVYLDSYDENDIVTFRIRASLGDKKELNTAQLEGDNGKIYDSMSKFIADNRTSQIWYAVEEDNPNSGQRGWENSWCCFRCSGCHRSISAARAYVYRMFPYSRMMPQKSVAPGIMRTQQTPYPVNVQPSEFFNGECWGGVPCEEAIEKTWSHMQYPIIPPSLVRWTQKERTILGWADGR